ncbi:MAG TPA: hypothetical protein VGG18_17060 [Granulicella sp.]
MTRAISQDEFINSASDLLQVIGQQTLLIQKDGETVAVLVSPREYESTREARSERAIQSLHAFREHMQSVATPEELDELEKALNSKAS